MERETRFELATLALARRCSTTELLPLVAVLSIPGAPNEVKPFWSNRSLGCVRGKLATGQGRKFVIGPRTFLLAHNLPVARV